MAARHNQHVTKRRTGLLIIRAWVEPGPSSPLRAQIRLATDVARGFDRTLAVAEEEAVVATVRGWLSEILAASHDSEDKPG